MHPRKVSIPCHPRTAALTQARQDALLLLVAPVTVAVATRRAPVARGNRAEPVAILARRVRPVLRQARAGPIAEVIAALLAYERPLAAGHFLRKARDVSWPREQRLDRR